MRRSSRYGLLVAIALIAVGCRTGRYKNPHDPSDGPIKAETLNIELRVLNENLFTRRVKGELDEDEYQRLLQKGADEILANVKVEFIDPGEAWQYAEVLRTAKHWKEAADVLRIAVRNANLTKNEDRRVNDSLRLAQALVYLGKTDEAITLARTTFKVRDQDAVPVLMSVLYEIVPPARGKGKDLALAQLLEDAIAVHARAKVDANSEAGRSFLSARSAHIRRAWDEAFKLYTDAKRTDLAMQVSDKAAALQAKLRG